jgi:hypothetical protein
MRKNVIYVQFANDVQEGTSKKARRTRKPHLVHTDSKYTVPNRLTDLLNEYIGFPPIDKISPIKERKKERKAV